MRRADKVWVATAVGGCPGGCPGCAGWSAAEWARLWSWVVAECPACAFVAEDGRASCSWHGVGGRRVTQAVQLCEADPPARRPSRAPSGGGW